MNEAVITLKPKLGYWIAKYSLLVVIVLLIPYLVRPFIVDVILHYMVMGGVYSRLGNVMLYIYRYAVCYEMDYN